MRILLIAASLLFCLSQTTAQSWKPTAEAQVRELRTSPLTVEVVDAGGNPVSDATVRLRMRQSAFRWGSIVQMGSVEDALLEGVPIGGNDPYWNHLRNFNALGAGNAGKWKQWLREDERAIYLDIMDWQRENDIGVRLHAPIWPSIRRWNAVPDFVVNAQATASETREEVVRRYVREFITSYMQIIDDKGAFEVDLVNELVNEPDLNVDLLGQTDIDDRIDEHVQWYQWAREAAPEVGLIVNEYNLYQSGNNFHERFVDYVSKMIERGAPIDGIGMQGHFFSEIPAYAELKRRLAEVAVLELPMAVTEFDMVNNTYAEMERVLYSVYSEPLVNNFTVWGAWDGNQWRGNAAIFNLDWSLKPSGRAWFDYVKGHWLTDTMVVTGTEALELRGHHGSYDLYVEHDGRVYQQTLNLARGESPTVRITLDEQASYARPSGQLELVGSPATVFPNQPFTLAVTADADIAEVTFYDDDQIIGFLDEAPFALTTRRTVGGQTLTPKAEVTYASGYRERLTAPAFTLDDQNSPPRIQDIFPTSGSTLLRRDSLRVGLTGVDSNGDALRVRLLLPNGDTLMGQGSGNHFTFSLTDELSLGSQRLTLILDDGKFAEDRQTVLYNIVSGEQEALSATTFPEGQNDDVEERSNGNVDLTGDLDLGERLTGIRFVNAAIPTGAIVDSAFVQFTSEKPDQTGAVSMDIFGELALNPRPLGGGNNNLSTRTPTSARVSWADVPDWLVLNERGPAQRTVDVGPIVREIVDQEGWHGSRPLHLFLDFGTGGSKRSAYAVDQNVNFRPVLTTFYRLEVDTTAPLAPVDLNAAAIGTLATRVDWADPNPDGSSLGYELEIDGALRPETARQRRFSFTDLPPGTYQLRVRTLGQFGQLSPFSEVLTFEVGGGICGEDGSVTAIADGLVVEDLGKTYSPTPGVVPDYLQFVNADLGGTTSVRRNDSTTLKWKTQGYYQRNRELGQIFNVPEGEVLTLDAVVLRTGNSSKAVLPNTPGAPVYIQFYEVLGTPVINDNGTPQGTESTHGFSTNHRTDDYLDGITYVPIAVVRGGEFPDIEPTTENGGQPGHLRYLRWDLQGDAELTLPGGRRYAFTVGFTEPGPEFGFSLGNNNLAASGAAPSLRTDANGRQWWSVRREGDGTLPPTQVPGDNPPEDEDLRLSLIGESLYEENHECRLMPTTDGYPDVDTYRTLEFYIETVNDCPPAGQTCDDGDPATTDDRTDGNCGCRGVLPDGCRADGMLVYERYNNIPGRTISELVNAAKYPDAPDQVDTLRTFEAPTDVAENYGVRIRGYLCPPTSGQYTFWIAGDDNVELRLGTDEDAGTATRIAFHDDWTLPREWDKYPTQQSESLFLEAGRPYYIEALMNEASGGDNLAVGWQLPDGQMQRPIGGASISTIPGDALSTGVSDPAVATRPLAIFPNPARDRMEVLLDYSGAVNAGHELQLFAADGRRVLRLRVGLQAGTNRLFIERPNSVPAGAYVLRVDTPEGIYLGRVVLR